MWEGGGSRGRAPSVSSRVWKSAWTSSTHTGHTGATETAQKARLHITVTSVLEQTHAKLGPPCSRVSKRAGRDPSEHVRLHRMPVVRRGGRRPLSQAANTRPRMRLPGVHRGVCSLGNSREAQAHAHGREAVCVRLPGVHRGVCSTWLCSYVSDLVLHRPLTIGYAYYDSSDGGLEVLDNGEYHPDLADAAVDLTG